MVKTVILEDNVHEMIKKRKEELKEKYKIEIKISDIVNNILIDNVDKYDLKWDKYYSVNWYLLL